MSEPASVRPWYTLIGPGLITACVVIGPGSIVTSSKVGAANNFSMLWVIAVSVAFMMVYMVLGAKLGAVAVDGPGDLIRQKAGRWLSVMVGICVFFISAAFQSGNNVGVASAFEAFVDSPGMVAALVVGFNVIGISFLFVFKNLYKVIERLMMVLVAVMLISFAVNLASLKPDVAAMAKGFIPSAGTVDLAVLGLVGTTFVITAAFYQAYLVRQKGWTVNELSQGIMDARIGSVIMAVITIMLMSTAAAGFNGKLGGAELSNPVAIAEALKGTFGSSAKVIFCLGLFSAAYSSFLVNSMIGGFIAADGFGLGNKPTDVWPRIMTTAVLLTGMTIALAAMVLGFDRTPTLIAAQAVTVVGAPLVAAVLLWLTSRKDIMGEHANSPATNLFAGVGLLLLLAIACNTAFVKLPKMIDDYRNPPTENAASADGQSREDK
jgi:manganese transport protein